MNTLQEYKAYYEKHAGELEFNSYYDLYFHPRYGFSEFKIVRNMLFAGSMCGNIDYWLRFARDMCKKHKLKTITTHVVRNLRPYLRRIGFRWVERCDRGDLECYLARNKDGELIRAEKVEDGFILTLEVKKWD